MLCNSGEPTEKREYADSDRRNSGFTLSRGKAFPCARAFGSLRIVPTGRHTDYIGSWLEVLREDNRASSALPRTRAKAADWLLGFLPGEKEPARPDREAA
ncbi:antirestriction protein ArdC [Bradyrhizobium sp. RT5a]